MSSPHVHSESCTHAPAPVAVVAAACPHASGVGAAPGEARFDAIVVGGGIAGSTTAAALGQHGFKTLVCEAGLPSTKRLAGELLHPPGAAQLEALGLLDAVKDAGGVPVYGFALFRNGADRGTVLSYSEIPGSRPVGIALEHAVMTRALLDAVARQPNVTVWNDARVLGADMKAELPMVAVRRGGSVDHPCAPLVVSAEGQGSKLREEAGICSVSEEPFRMVGWKIAGARLPYPGYGHVFIGGKTPTLAYQVSKDEVRIMFELSKDETEITTDLVEALPEPFRSDVVRGMTHSPKSSARFQGFRPDRVVSGSLAVVGDAGGCVHPLIASGMSFSVADGARLASALRGPSDDLQAGLRRYQNDRKGPMRTRSALGPAMVEALCSRDPSMQLLRHGLFRYWEHSRRGRGASMALLSTREDSMVVMAREYALVCAHAATGLIQGAVASGDAIPAVKGLVSRTAGLLRAALAA